MSRVSLALRTLLLATAVAGVGLQARAGTLTAVAPVAGAASQSLLGINNAGWTTGSFVDSATGMGVGFLRDPSGTYSTFSYDTFTQGRAVGNGNAVVGYSNGSNGVENEFIRAPDGTHAALTNPGTGQPLNGIAQGVNDNGLVVGNYQVSPGVRDGFILNTVTNSFTTLAPDAGYASVAARGIANDGTVVGWATAPGGTTPFVYSGGAYSYLSLGVIDAGATSAVLEGVNNVGMAVGTWTDASQASHGFEYDLNTHAITQLSQLAPDETLTTWGINDSGKIVMSSTAGSFIYDPNAAVSAPDGSAVFAPTVGITLPPNVSQFTFNVVAGQTYYIDPAAAGGYLYTDNGGPQFASFTAPTGYAPGDSYQLWLFSTALQRWVFDTDVTGGVAFNFNSPVDQFVLRGLNVTTGSPDFVTGLTFASAGAFNGQQIALAAPEPASWALLIMGFGLAGASLRRRRAKPTAVTAA